MLKSKPRSKRKNPCPPFVCGFNPSTKKTRFKRNPDKQLLVRRITDTIDTIEKLLQHHKNNIIKNANFDNVSYERLNDIWKSLQQIEIDLRLGF